MAQKPRIPKGTRDFSPEEVSKRNYIIHIIRTHFERFGFQPIETPSMELSETLMGKYGDEGDRLIFKILNSGDFLSKVNRDELGTIDLTELTSQISEKALRYDLTVPFARYVVQHQNEIEFPFKRYQIQPVWRADRPQRGRFREFYQCDADVVGSDSIWQEVEFIKLYDSVFHELGLKGVTIKINNRKILSGIAEMIGASDKLIDFTVALDKLAKIGEEKVKEEMLDKGIPSEGIKRLQPLFNLKGEFNSQIESLQSILSESDTALKGLADLKKIADAISELPLKASTLDMDVTLARGLNYYTGCILEVSAPDGVNIGSIGGGGRYDDLTGIFGLNDISGVGISFGLDRIYMVLEELKLFPKAVSRHTSILFINFGEEEALYCLKAIEKLRDTGIKAELYPDDAKMKKQLQYANRRDIPYVALVGKDEITSGSIALKNMHTGDQRKLSLDELIQLLK